MSPGTIKHTDRVYEGELQVLREKLLRMAGRVEEMIALSTRAVVERDVVLAKRTIALDQQVNQDEIQTDELCLSILARRQPLASDLRFITLALKMVTDLERIGDLAVNICERAIELAKEPPMPPIEAIPRIAALAERLVHDAIDALVSGDADKAAAIVERDVEVDALYHEALHGLLAFMNADSSMIQRAIHMQAVAKFIERIGDHGTNIAEEVVFLVKGKDIRHMGRRTPNPLT